ncbi:MAG: sulfate ABC transporter permease subunit CysT [Planctomycetes bacterium]|nr:sulfate ABC transporter permease subunit CysT [Planctomycetota bacterium]
MAFLLKRRTVVPGFGLSLGLTVLYTCLVVLIPLAGLFVKSWALPWAEIGEILSAPRVVASFKLTFLTSLIAASLNLVFGLLVAWVLVRYRFPGKSLLDALVDLPFALPTAVAGITLTTLYARNGWIGQYLEPYGIKAAYSQLGIVIALTFIGLPFVVRTVQPVLEDLDPESEDAAYSLGAGRLQVFTKVVLPLLWPALLTGFALSFARALGEYGSVVFIAGNMPMKTEVVSLLIVTRLEEYDYAGATTIAAAMLLMSFVVLLIVNLLQWWSRRWQAA